MNGEPLLFAIYMLQENVHRQDYMELIAGIQLLIGSFSLSHRACVDAVEHLNDVDFCLDVPDWDSEGTVHNEEMVLITQSKRVTTNYV